MASLDEAHHAAAEAINLAIVSSQRVSGGHTGDVVERLTCKDGSTVILKAAPRWQGSGTMLDYGINQEIEFYRGVPQLEPWRAALLGTIRTQHWVGFVLADLDQPQRRIAPWSSKDAEAISAGLAAMHGETLSGVQPTGVLAYSEGDYWDRAAVEGEHSPEWRRWITEVSRTASAAISTTRPAGSLCVTHGDIYDDNIFLVGGQVYLIDWAQVGWTSRSRDAVRWALAAEAFSGITAPMAFGTYERYAGRQPPEERRMTLAAASSFMILRLGQERHGTELRRTWRGVLIQL